MNEAQYKRLPGRGRTISGASRLWLGGDHVLMVQSLGYSESYKRFFFADVQAIVVSRTHAGKFWNAIWITLAVLFGLFGAGVGTIDTGAIILWSIAGLFALGLAFNLWLGPTCICQVRTAVQVERVAAINRMKRARKLLERLRPLIAAAQGEMPPEELAAAFDRKQELAETTPPVIV
jgi:hypothetical protein